MKRVFMGVPAFLLAASLKLVLSQRLVRTLCTYCKSANSENGVSPVGCEKCNETGFRGRTSIIEALKVNSEVAEIIGGNYEEVFLRDYASKNGMKLLKDSGMRKVRDGKTTVEEVYKQTLT